MESLRGAMEGRDEKAVRKALKDAVPTFYDPEEINASAVQADEMQMAAS